MTLLVDDQILSRVLRSDALPGRLDWSQPIFTTGYWYVRLCQAVLGVAARPGALSGPFEALVGRRRDQAIAAVLELPEEIGLLSLRELGVWKSLSRPKAGPSSSLGEAAGAAPWRRASRRRAISTA